MEYKTGEEELIEQVGLCTFCAHKTTCTTRIFFTGQILQCEEFENTTFQKDARTNLPEEESVSYTPLKGLCMNCDLASICKLPKPVTGVWSCNEYK